MSYEHFEEKEAVKIAALIETNGLKFYNILGGRVTDPEVKTIISNLARDEKQHLQVIEKMFFPRAGFTEQITDEEVAMEANIESSGQADIFTKHVNMEEVINALGTPVKALELALEAEKYSVTFFTELSEKAETQESRRLYEELADEEKRHVAKVEGIIARIS
ncbi:MAG: ferritin family protein [Thermodesulfobacteriota bacterium]